MTFPDFISTYCSTFWHGVLLSSMFWLCLLNLSLWYWRRRIRELGVLVNQVIVAAPESPLPEYLDEDALAAMLAVFDRTSMLQGPRFAAQNKAIRELLIQAMINYEAGKITGTA